jgi:TldD protein
MAISLGKAILLTALSAGSTGDGDVVFRAMHDELDRSMQQLQLPGHEKPFFISYTVRDVDKYAVAASFGGITSRHCTHTRSMEPQVLVGDYKLNSNKDPYFSFSRAARFMGPFMHSGSDGVVLPVDDNYYALRRAIWEETDDRYKNAIENFAAKKAYLAANKVTERPDDLSKETPEVIVEPLGKLTFDRSRWDQNVRQLSDVFRTYPYISRSAIGFAAGLENRWYLNSEGFKNRQSIPGCGLGLLAVAPRDDGSKAGDCEFVFADTVEQMPALPELEKMTREFAERLDKLRTAKAVTEEYDGPILFEGQAAAEFFADILAPQLGNTQESSGYSMSKNLWREKIGQKVLPTFMSVTDDPAAKEYKGTPIYGASSVDEDGLRPQKLTLIDHGILKTFCMSRIPTRQLTKSNGHSSGGVGVPTTLFITADTSVPFSQLRARLIAEGKEQGLKYVYIIRRLSNLLSSAVASGEGISRTSGDVVLMPPQLIYQVSTADGHEELVRDVSFSHVEMRVLKDIEGCADDSKAYPVVGMLMAKSVVTPSILIKEMELEKRQGKPTKNEPILEHPYHESHKKK